MATRAGKRKKPDKTGEESAEQPKRPKRGYHMFKNGLLNVTPKGQEMEVAKTNSESSSLLLLPREIRDTIWKYVLGNKVFECGNSHFKKRTIIFNSMAAKHDISLLLTCRQIYVETGLVTYQVSNFVTEAHAIRIEGYFFPSLRKIKAAHRQHIHKVVLQMTWLLGSNWVAFPLVATEFCRLLPGLRLVTFFCQFGPDRRRPQVPTQYMVYKVRRYMADMKKHCPGLKYDIEGGDVADLAKYVRSEVFGDRA